MNTTQNEKKRKSFLILSQDLKKEELSGRCKKRSNGLVSAEKGIDMCRSAKATFGEFERVLVKTPDDGQESRDFIDRLKQAGLSGYWRPKKRCQH